MVEETMSGQSLADSKSKNWRNRFRTFTVAVLATVGVVGVGIYIAAHWVEDQVLTTNNWVALVSPIPKEPAVSSALGKTISTQVFQAAPVEQRITEALPPKAAFLAGPLTSQLQNATTSAAQNFVASDSFQAVWEGANRLAMNRLLAKARGQPTPLQSRIDQRFDIDISQTAAQVRERLGAASAAIPALQSDSGKRVVISTDLRARQQRLHQFVRTTDTLNAILPMVIAASFLGSLALARHRRRTTIVIAGSIIVLMLLELVALKWLRQETLAQVQVAGNLPAVTFIFDAVVAGLRNLLLAVMAVMAVVIGLMLLAGRAKWAVAAKSFVHLERLQNSRLSLYWQNARVWVMRWERYLWLGAFLLVLVILGLVIDVSGRTAVNALLLTLSLFALFHLMATPHQHGLSDLSAHR